MFLQTTEHIPADLEAMRRWHARRSFQASLPDRVRSFHREAAKGLTLKLHQSSKAAWTWESFIESVRKSCQNPTEGEFLQM